MRVPCPAARRTAVIFMVSPQMKTGFVRLRAPRQIPFEKVVRFHGHVWLGHQDSNLDPQLQRLVCCHCTMPQCAQDCITIFLFARNKSHFFGFFERNHFRINGLPSQVLGSRLPKIIRRLFFCLLCSCGIKQRLHLRSRSCFG